MKRFFDLISSILAILMLSWVIGVIALIIKLTSKGPALYFSDRVGKHNLFFRMPKFRTMQVGTPAVATHLLPDSNQYLTPVG